MQADPRLYRDIHPSPPLISGTPRRDVLVLGGSSVMAAVLGWATLVIVARQLGPEAYAHFSVLWGLFFAVGGVCAGLQQEVTRSISSVKWRLHPLRGGRGARPFVTASLIALAMVATVSATSALWGRSVLGSGAPLAVVALACGIGGLSVFTAACGALAAQDAWLLVGLAVIGDSTLRLFATLFASSVPHASSPALMWAIAAGPFAIAALVPIQRFRTALMVRGDSTIWEFTRRSLTAMLAAGCTALVVTGFPFLVRATNAGPLGGSAGVLFAAVLVTRTGLLLPLNGYRLKILTRFVGHRADLGRSVMQVMGLWIALGCLGSAVSFWLGPWLLTAMYGAAFEVSRFLLIGLTGAATLTALLSISGTALLAIEEHWLCTVGWAVALAGTVLGLCIPGELSQRCLIALTLGPICGLLAHATLFLRRGSTRRLAKR